MKNLIKNLLIITILVGFTACGTVNKLKHKSDVKTDSTSIVKTVTTITTTEKLDTNIAVPKDSLKRTITEQQLEKGDTITTHENGITIKTFEDPKTKSITEKVITDPKSVHAFMDKKTVSVIKTSTDTEVKKEIKQSDKSIERTGFRLGFWGWFWIILILLLIIAYCIFRKYIKTAFPFLP